MASVGRHENMSASVVAAIVVGVVLWAVLCGGRLPRQYRARSCQGRAWRSTFPDASKSEIREFLELFVSAFAFSSTERLKLNPDDRVLAVYRALYPHRWMADALEVETLSVEFERKYGTSLGTVQYEHVTLGELFALSRAGHQRVT